MTKSITAFRWEWFPVARDDTPYLDLWRDVPVSYARGQALDSDWHVDHYEEAIGWDSTGQLFDRAADRLMRYRFYPIDLIRPTSDFGLQRRRLRVGDRLVQRIHVLNILDVLVLDVLTMNEVSEVVDEPRRKGFAYVTTRGHSERGEWSAVVEWRETGEVRLTVHAVSKPSPQMPWPARRFARRLQKNAHRRGIDAFKQTALAGE